MRLVVAVVLVLLIGPAYCAAEGEAAQQAAPAADSAAGKAADPSEQPAPPATPKVQNPAPDRGAKDAEAEQVELESIDSAPVGKIVHATEPRTKRPLSFYVPTTYRGERPMPLLAAFTAGGVGRANITELWRLGEDHGVIILTPDTWAVRGSPEERVKAERQLEAWSRDMGATKVPNYVRQVDDILVDLRADAEALRQSVAMLSARYAVDPKLVVLTGSSGGTWVAYYAGLAAPQRYAGICIRSGNFDRRLLPSNLGRARDMPISIVIGDQDLSIVLAETDKAEECFKTLRFKNVNVERLPNSGHDSRPEVALNFVSMLRGEVMAERRAQWQQMVKAGQKAIEQKRPNTARYELVRAAEMEKQFGFSDEATQALKALEGDSRPEGKQPSGAGNESGQGGGATEKPATN